MFRDSCLCPSKSRARNKKIKISNKKFRDSCLSSSKFKAIYVQYTASNKRKTIKCFSIRITNSPSNRPRATFGKLRTLLLLQLKIFGVFYQIGRVKNTKNPSSNSTFWMLPVPSYLFHILAWRIANAFISKCYYLVVAIFVRGRGQIFLGERIPVLVRDFNATE